MEAPNMANQVDPYSFTPFDKKSLKEQVTPHKMAVVVLIQEYCVMKKSDFVPFAPDNSFTVDTNTVKFTEREKRNFMVTILELLQAPDPPLKELCIKVKDSLKSELFEVFCKRLQSFNDEGVGEIQDYFQNTFAYLLLAENQEQTVLTRSSVLGLFIRRMILAFEKLTFSQVVKLHTKFQRYYSKANLQGGYEDSQDFGGSLTDSVMSLSGVRFSKGGFGRSFDPFHATADRETSDDSGGFYSQKQAEYFISQQGFLLQHNEGEALSPTALQEKIRDMLKANPDVAEAHFLSYLNNLRVKEYCAAFHNLFHYFDRNTYLNSEPASQGGTQVSKNRKEVSRRYAALNLAALHYRFGHNAEAEAALKEAIGMAQETNDHVCLQHALGWLHRLGNQGTASTENLLERAVAKSSELNLPYLTSLGIQAFAKHNAFASAVPCSVFQYLQQSDILNCQHSQSGFMCTSYANKAALWKMYGKKECLSMMSQLILNLDTSQSGVYYSGEAVCIALCNIAKLHSDNGQYGIALDLINNAKKRFPSKTYYAHVWMSTEQEILFDRTLLNRKFNVAEQAVQNLRALNQNEADLREAQLNKEKGNVSAALAQLHHLLDVSSSKTENQSVTPDFFCRVLLLLGELYTQTGNTTTASSYTLECMWRAKRHHLQYLEAMGMVQLAYIQLHMQLPEQAMTLLMRTILIVLSQGSKYDQARFLYCYVKCRVAESAGESSSQRKTVLLSAVSLLNTVIEMFESTEAFLRVKDTVYYQARLYNDLGYRKERNKCAYQFKQLQGQYPTLTAMSLNVL